MDGITEIVKRAEKRNIMDRRPALTNDPMPPVRITENENALAAPAAQQTEKQTIPGSIYWFDRLFTVIGSTTSHDHLQQEIRKLQTEFRGNYPGYFPESATPQNR